MKKSLVLASLLALSVSCAASDSSKNWFIGIEGGTAELDFTVDGESYSVTDDSNYLSLKGGKYFGNSRIGINYNFYNTEYGGDMSAYGVGYDYIFDIATSKLSPYVGVNIQYASYEKLELNLNGISYGLGCGIMYEANKNFDIELGLKYNIDSGEDTVVEDSTVYEIALDNTIHIGIGINYNF